MLVAVTVRTLRTRRRHRDLLDLLATPWPAVPGAHVLDHPVPVAYCLPGLRSRLVLSAGVLDALEPAAVAAVLAHERAHLRERHDLVVLPFVAWGATAPFVRGMVCAQLAVAALVEMRADDVADRGYHPHPAHRGAAHHGRRGPGRRADVVQRRPWNTGCTASWHRPRHCPARCAGWCGWRRSRWSRCRSWRSCWAEWAGGPRPTRTGIQPPRPRLLPPDRGWTDAGTGRSSMWPPKFESRGRAVNDLLTRLRVATTDVERRDDALRAEMQERRDAAALVPERAGAALDPVVEIGGQQVDRFEFEQETIVLRTGRPVLAIVRDGAQLVFDDPESEVWKQRLQDSSSLLVDAARATGRIEVEGHSLAWLGTGWLVKSDVVVTNRHVAAEFGRHSGTSFVFRQGLNGRNMKASIDFLEEHGRSDSLMFRLEQILHIEDVDGPDIAFIRVSPVDGQSLATPVGLAMRPNEDELVAVIGYPARDSRIPDQPLMDRIFGDVYDKKRLAPGQVTRFDTEVLRHDCSTLGGNSGSAVISLRTGMAVGLHFAGRFLQTNFAVPSTVVGERLEQVLGDARRTRRGDHRVEEPVARRVAGPPGARDEPGGCDAPRWNHVLRRRSPSDHGRGRRPLPGCRQQRRPPQREPERAARPGRSRGRRVHRGGAGGLPGSPGYTRRRSSGTAQRRRCQSSRVGRMTFSPSPPTVVPRACCGTSTSPC